MRNCPIPSRDYNYTRCLIPRKKFKSQTLIEVVLSIGLAAMVLSALLVLGAASSKTVASSLKRSQATKLAVEAIEAVRYARDKNGFAYIQEGCYKLNATALDPMNPCDANTFESIDISVDASNTNNFERRIYIEDDASNLFSKNISVSVRWLEATGDTSGGDTYKSINLNTVLAKW